MIEFKGYVEDIKDALILIEASCKGYLTQKEARLTFNEKLQIRSGTTFILNETATNIKRWSDGISWTPSRLIDGFFVYQQQSTLPYNPHDSETVHVELDKQQVLHKKSIVVNAPNNDRYHLFNYYRPVDIINKKLTTPKNSELMNIPDLLNQLSLYTFKGQFNDVSKPSRKRVSKSDTIISEERRLTLPSLGVNHNLVKNIEEERLSLPSLGEALNINSIKQSKYRKPNSFSIDSYHLEKLNSNIKF